VTKMFRRASDWAQLRMQRATTRGDRVAWLIAFGYYEAAMARRAAWSAK
jgi:hypothetical protein